jgi:Sulfatase-modifying factor enzyme 1/Caspase domain
MMLHFFARALAIGVMLMATAAYAETGRIVALTVGINKYDSQNPKISQLYKARADAETFHNVLAKDLKISTADIQSKLDATKDEVMAAYDEMLAKLAKRKDGIAIFHFAGHGVELGGRSLLLARDVKIGSQGQLLATSIDMQELLAKLAKVQDIRKEALGIFIIDACRENPDLLKAVPNDVGLGVAPPYDKLPRSVFLLYSAGIGQLALDGDGTNSVFMTELLPLLRQLDPKLPLADLAQAVRFKVYVAASKHKDEKNTPYRQTPAYYDQLQHRTTLLGDVVSDEVTRPPAVVASVSAGQSVARGLGTGGLIMDCAECPEMVLIPPMPGGRPIAVGKFEVTRREWNACVRDNNKNKCDGLQSLEGRDGQRDREPVTYVSSDDAKAYVAWLNDVTKRPDGKNYRLPTQAEWEHAARGGEQGATFPVDEQDGLCRYANGADKTLGSLLLVDSAACSDGVGRGVAVAGRYKANGYGLHDVLGNAWEWTASCASGTDGAAASAPANCTRYVARGGSWRSPPAMLNFSAQHAFARTHKRATLGFRVVLDLER